jgi:maleate cis-trans isomerase
MRPSVVATACLVAIMAQAPYAPPRHAIRDRIGPRARAGIGASGVIGGRLVDALHALGARRIAMVTPYLKELTQLVAEYTTMACAAHRGTSHRSRRVPWCTDTSACELADGSEILAHVSDAG